MRWALVALAIAGCARHANDVELVGVERGDLVLTVEVNGELAAVDSTDIKTPVIPGVGDYFAILELAPEGSEVKAGQMVAVLDPSNLNRNLEALQAQVKQAQTLLEQRREQNAANRRRDDLTILQAEAAAWKATTATDVPLDLVATVDMRARRLEEEQAKMALQQVKLDAEASRKTDEAVIRSLLDDRENAVRRADELTRNAARLTIVSPRAGTVVYVARGEKLKVGQSVADTFLDVVGLGAMIGNGAVDEVDIARISRDQPVVLRVDALPDVRLHGVIAELAASVQAKSYADPSKIVRLKLAIEATRNVPLRPGMRFRGEVETLRIPNVLQIPAEAVFVTPDGPVAYRETAAGLERVQLELGSRSTETIEVKSGLAAGDRLSLVQGEP